MRSLSVIILLAALILPPVASAETQTFTATHTYILGDRDSKEDARQRCLLETKRKILEQVGVYIESASEVKNFDLTKDKITSFAAAVMQVKDTKEKVGFENGHMTLTLTTTAQVDLTEVRKQLAARQLDAGVRDTVAAQQERLKRLEAQLEAMQQAPGYAPASPSSDMSAADLQMIRTQAAQGDVKAQYSLGLLYDAEGHGVPQDYATARGWYEKAAIQGNALAQNNLGMLYFIGRGVPQDYKQARQWWEKAATQNDAAAQTNLGALYCLGQGVPQDYAQAQQWWEKAAAQGYATAQRNLGTMYFDGLGVPQDYAQAAYWYEKAAAQGLAEAQTNLGGLYYFGRGVPQDYATARGWYEKAAVQGYAPAQFTLGVLYAIGLGVPQDYVRAYMWYRLAAPQITGDDQKSAANSREAVALRMTPAQIAEAQRLSQQCQARQLNIVDPNFQTVVEGGSLL